MNIKSILLIAIFSIYCYTSSAQCTVQGVKIQAFLADPNGSNNFDTDGDGSADTEDEFVQICNTTTSAVTLTGFTLSDNTSVGYSFPAGDVIGAGECITIIRQWQNTMVTIPANFREMGSGGGFFNNGGDDIVLTDGTTTCTVTYPNVSYPEQDGCVTVIGTTTGSVDCSITPADLTNSPLPVDLISFTASKSEFSVELKWSTASEVNNSHFEIYKSTDIENFEQIGTVYGKGNSQVIAEYQFIDRNLKGAQFYRLKQVDYDGQFEYSDIISVKGEESNREILSQTADKLIVKSTLQTRIIITTQSGQVLADLDATENRTINKNDYPNGMFIIQAINAEGMQTIKWINAN